MTQPEPDPNHPAPWPAKPQPGAPRYPPHQHSAAEYGAPQHLWPDYAQPQAGLQWAVVPAAQERVGSGIFAALALLLGFAALVAPFVPADMTGFRQYAPFPFALPGIALAVIALTGRRPAKPLAITGATLSVLAIAIGLYMVTGTTL